MTQRRCPTHGAVDADAEGFCPTCRAMTEMVNTAFYGTYNAMTDADERETDPMLDKNSVHPDDGWVLKTAHQRTQICILLIGFVLMLSPVIVVGSVYGNNMAASGAKFIYYVCCILSFATMVGLVWWWIRVYFAGGVTTIAEDRNCSWHEYSYYEKSNGPFFVFNKIKRTNGSSACEIPRCTCMVFIIVIIFLAGVGVTSSAASSQ